MAKATKKVPAAKAVTFAAFGFMVALGVLFLMGLVRFAALGDKPYGVEKVIEEAKEIFKDVDGYFKNLTETIKMYAEHMEGGSGISDLVLFIFYELFPLVAVIYFAIVALRLAFCWTPLLKGGKSWSKASIKMCKKMKGMVNSVLAYLIYCMTLYGFGFVKFSSVGMIAVYLIAAFAIVRVLLHHIGKKDSPVGIVLSTIAAAAIAVFATVTIKFFLENCGAIWVTLFNHVEGMMQAMDGDAEGKIMAAYVMLVLSFTFMEITINHIRTAMEHQAVMNQKKARGALVAFCIFTIIVAALNFFAFKQYYGELSFGDWKKMEQSKFVVKLAIYGIAGLAVSIVSGILCKIGAKASEDDEDDEDDEIEE